MINVGWGEQTRNESDIMMNAWMECDEMNVGGGEHETSIQVIQTS